MHTYLFYPELPDGVCLSWSSVELVNDAAALEHAALVLDEHDLAAEVSVWRDDLQLGKVQRTDRASRPGPAAVSKLHVLLVEDEFLIAEDFRVELDGAGVAVTCVGDEDTALSCIASTCLDGAFVDIDLGKGPRYRVAEALTERRIPFVFVTGWTDLVIPSRWRHVERLTKPVNKARLTETSLRLLHHQNSDKHRWSDALSNVGA